MRIAEHTTHRIQPSPINRHNPATKRLSRHIGRTNFHAKFISWSCLRRGNVPRSQIKTHIEMKSLPKNQIHEGMLCSPENGAIHPPRKSVEPRPEIMNFALFS